MDKKRFKSILSALLTLLILAGIMALVLRGNVEAIMNSIASISAASLIALLALGGDLGCTAGPGLVGFISNRFNDNMKTGFFAGTIFPIVLLIAIYMCKKIKRND